MFSQPIRQTLSIINTKNKITLPLIGIVNLPIGFTNKEWLAV
jgi:hypothetical protein